MPAVRVSFLLEQHRADTESNKDTGESVLGGLGSAAYLLPGRV